MAGCTQTTAPAKPTNGAETSHNGTVTGMPGSGGSVNGTGGAAFARIVAFNRCQGFHTSFDYPPGMAPANPPGNWRASVTTTAVYLTFLECDRVSWGPYERGPIRMIWEKHNNFQPPSTCQEGAWDLYEALASLWVSDQDLARYLNATYGMTTHYTEITSTTTSNGVLLHMNWTWALPGQTSSSLSVNDAQEFVGPAPEIIRIAWSSDSRLFVLDYAETDQLSAPLTDLAFGVLQPPMLYTKAGTRQYAGDATMSQAIQVSASIQGFSDYLCKQSL